MIERAAIERDRVELRALQARAYARDGTLTALQAERLRELQSRRGVIARSTGSVVVASGPSTGSGASSGGSETSSAGSPSPASPAEAPTAEHAPVVRSRPRWMTVSAAVLVLATGVGIGWLLFGRDGGSAIAITPEQQVRGAEIAAESTYDPGSMTPLAEDGGVLVWAATRNEGDLTCVILDDGVQSRVSCTGSEMIAPQGVNGRLEIDGPGDARETVYATLLHNGTGELVATIQRWTMTGQGGYLDQFTAESERATAERMAEEGIDEWSMFIAGYDGDTPIWAGIYGAGGEFCLFYGGDRDAPSACAPTEQVHSSGVALRIPDPERHVTLRFTSEQRMPYLVITDRPSPDAELERSFDDLVRETAR